MGEEMLIDEGLDLRAETFGRKTVSRGGDGGAGKLQFFEFRDGGSERRGGLRGKKKAVLTWLDDVTAATFSVGDDWAASSKGFDGGDTERLKARKEISAGGLEIWNEFATGEPREEGDEA